MRRTTFAVIVIAMVVSGYFIFQCTNVVAYNSFSRGIVVATRLVAVEFLNLNHTGPSEGDFALLLTFGNPTTQTSNITAVNALYYIEQGPGSSLAARGNAGGSTELGLGETQFILPMFDSVPQVSAPEHFQCIVYYRLEFGSAHYRFEYLAYDSVTQTRGPYILGGEDHVFPQVATYTLLVVDVWALGLEVMGALALFQEKEHHKMLALIYALQGIGLLVFYPLVALLQKLVTPPAQVYSSAGGWSAYIWVGAVELAGLVFLLTAWGVLQRKRSAVYVGLFLSSISAFLSLYACVYVLTSLVTVQELALSVLSIVTFGANVIAFCILLKRRALF